jgi:hypothetical protein
MRRASFLALVAAALFAGGSSAATPVLPGAPHPQALCAGSSQGSPDDPVAVCFSVGAPIGQTTAARSFAGSPADVQLMTPQTLHAAYALPATTPGSGSQTIGVVDAFDDPTVQADLDFFDTWFGLPALPACSSIVTTSCFEKVNQSGATSGFPAFNSGWATEIALDVETAHAICENCKVVLVEATTNSLANLAASVDTAASLGATVISNSYGAAESGMTSTAFTQDGGHYRKPGVAIVASAGDDGWGSNFPADVSTVVSVGGTTLSTDPATGAYISESVWFSGGFGTGSGCSSLDTAQPWQSSLAGWPATGCGTGRGIADVAADADPASGMYVRYNSLWYGVGGTSLSAPIIAATYALAANPSTTLTPVAVPYTHSASLHDVTSGTNTSSSCPSTICAAAAGYDGPTGLGTPNGITAFVDTGTAPANAVLPAVTGTAAVGQTLTGTLGTWWAARAIAYQRQWMSCTTGCVALAGMTGPNYTVKTADIGHTIELQVTATDASGTTVAVSTPTPAVPGLPPANTALPTITGPAAVGQTLTGSLGTWTGTSPVTKTKQWLRCTTTCTPISGMTGNNYLVHTADIGDTIELAVTATNTWGTTTATSAATASVPGLPPTNTVLPSISGTPTVGQALTAVLGTWTGTAPITKTKQWLRCNSSGGACVAIGAVGTTYTVRAADAGHTLRLRVTASNAWSSGVSATSASTAVVGT